MKNLSQTLLTVVLGIVSVGPHLEGSAKTRDQDGVWLVDGDKKNMAFVTTAFIQDATCKIINGQKVYILPKGKILPSTDTLRTLSSEQSKRLDKALNCK